jgi:hypothetical protein
MGLVEEVRDILDLHEKMHHMTKKSLVKKFGKSTPHNPFKNAKGKKRLGGTSKKVARLRGPSTTTPGKYRGFWRCRCSDYNCHCVGKTAEGKEVEKHVRIDKAYKKKYNAAYRKWRATPKAQKALGTRLLKKKKQPHHKGYHAD